MIRPRPHDARRPIKRWRAEQRLRELEALIDLLAASPCDRCGGRLGDPARDAACVCVVTRQVFDHACSLAAALRTVRAEAAGH
jgi:hypothetical protein